MKKMVVFLCFMMIAALLSAETAPDTLWTKTFGGDGYQRGYSVQQTSDGGYIMAGRRNLYGNGDYDYDAWLIKTDENGEVEWTQTYGGSYIDEVYVVRQTLDGGYIAGGTSTAFGGAGKGWLIRTDSTGNELWQYGYRADGSTSSYWNYIHDIVVTDNGDFVAAGFTTMDVYAYQGWVIRVDADGTLLWNRQYGIKTYWDRLTEIEPTNDGNFIVAGDQHATYDGGSSYRADGWIMKVSSDGDSLWAYTYGGEETDLFRALCINNDGSIIAGSSARSYSSEKWAESEAWLVKTDSDGNEIWNKTFGEENYFSMVQCLDNNDIVASGGTDTENDADDGLVLKMDEDGNILWEKHIFASSAGDVLSSFQQTSDGGYILGGRTNSWATGEGDLWLVKLEAEVTALTSFTENFDEVTTPDLPDNWTSCMDVLPANTVADVYTTLHVSAPSSPNAVLIMNGLDGSSGQLDSTAFVSLITPLVEVGDNGSTLTFWALGGNSNSVIVGTMSDPTDTTSFTPIEEIALDYSFAEYSVSITSPGTTYLAFKHGNTSTCATVFVDDISFEQNAQPLTSFTEDFDEVTTPALPDNWTSCMDVLLSNTVADVYTTLHYSAPSSPNAVLIMNGLDGSSGQLDSTAFVSLITPLVEVGDNGSTLTFWALGGNSNSVIVGTMSDPTDTTTFTPIEEVALDYSFAEYSVSITSPGTTYLAFKHGNTSTCATVFVDDISFGPQLSNDENIDIEQNILTNYPNPVIGSTTIKYSCKDLSPSESVDIKIYNILGQLVEVVEGRDGTATWNSDNHSTGIYFYRIEAESFSEIRKMIVIK